MRLAVFTFQDNSRRIAMLPTKVCVFEAFNPSGDAPVIQVTEDGENEPFTVQGTFEEAVAEVNTALSKTVLSLDTVNPLHDASLRTSTIADCDNPLPSPLSRCPKCGSGYKNTKMHPTSGKPVRMICGQCTALLWEKK